nr:Uncharacterised protein [Streptococcus thermophilus]
MVSRKPRRRASRPAETDYDRNADTPIIEEKGDGERHVEFDEEPPILDERPPHYGGD